MAKSTTLDGKNSRGESALDLAKQIIKSNKNQGKKPTPKKKGK